MYDACYAALYQLVNLLLILAFFFFQLEIIELLLKACNSMEKYAHKVRKILEFLRVFSIMVLKS